MGRHRAAVLGSPISHSLSPVLHRAAYAALGLSWSYEAVEVTADELAGFVAGLDDSWVGLSLTMPLKEAVLPLLGRVTEAVRVTGAANTVLFGEEQLRGENTDVFGIVAAVREAGTDTIERACVIGAGATARSAVAAAVQLGAKHVTIVVRRPEATVGAVAAAHALGVVADVQPWSRAAAGFGCELVLSTVPGDAGATLVGAIPPTPAVLLDVTYRPWPTSLAAAWSDRGGVVIPGARMLLWQAARQVELMTGLPAPVAAMDRALAAAG